MLVDTGNICCVDAYEFSYLAVVPAVNDATVVRLLTDRFLVVTADNYYFYYYYYGA